jgi:hypothetical protein
VSSDRLDDDELPRALVDAWRAEAREPKGVERAYLRFQRRARPELFRATPPVLRWVLLGIAIGMSSVYAATGAVTWLRSPARQSAAAMHDARRARPPRPRSVEAPQPEPPSEPAEPPESSEPPNERTGVVPPVRGAATIPSAPAASSGASEQWQRAARSLRERDFQTAQDALAELLRTSSGGERESALLVQAQLLFVQGREAEAIAILQSLRVTAKLPSVQQKAAELLVRKSGLPSQRSFDPAEGTKKP